MFLLPLVLAWYAFGWYEVLAWVGRRTAGRRPVWLRSATLAPAVLVLPLLLWQLPRDYLLNRGESTPSARGSGYVSVLREMTPRGWSIEAGYQWTIADLTGRTATNELHNTLFCQPGASADVDRVRATLRRDHVATVIDAWVKWPKNMDNLCLLS